ncbi:MAG: SNF2-related protein [bacterium]
MKITNEDIRNLVSTRIFRRGVDYYHSGFVELLDVEEHAFRAIVSGTYDYMVEVRQDDEGWFDASCNCPYWDECKHIVAAMLEAKEYYDSNVGGTLGKAAVWKQYLEEIEEGQWQQRSRAPQWQLFYSLEFSFGDWKIFPQKVYIKKDGSPGRIQKLAYTDFSNADLERTRNDDLALSYLEKWQGSNRNYFFSYEGRGPVQFPYAERVGVLFGLLRNSRLFLHQRDELGKKITFSEHQGQVEFRLDDQDDGAQLCPVLLLNGEEMIIDDSFRVLTSDPVWLCKDDLLIEITGLHDARCLVPFTRKNYDLTIPKEELPQFLGAITSQLDLFENFRMPEGTRFETRQEITEKRLYLVETGNGLEVKLRLCYDSVEVDSHDSRQTLWGSGAEGNTFIKAQRDKAKEAEVLESLLDRGVKLNRDGRLTLPSRQILDWLIEEVPKLTAEGFVIFGEENLKQYKVNRSAARVSVAVESGIDWFDLNMEIDFGGVLLSLKELRKSLQKKSRYVKLADGSTAQLPKKWLDRFRHVLNLSEEASGKLKLSRFHVTLIDELFAEASQQKYDKLYRASLKRLKDFNGIKAVATPKALKGELRSYQEAGFHWLHFLQEFQFGGCLADDMGLGKTIQALALLLLQKQRRVKEPSLIVTPTSVIFNWLDEIKRFAPGLRVLNQTGLDRKRTRKSFKQLDVVLTSYGTLRRDIPFLREVQFNYVILDESQYIKNPISQTAKAAKLLQARHRLALTGTPVENNTLELWSLFSFLNPGLLGNLHYFKGAFARPIEQNRDVEVASLLKKMVYPFILRRTKGEVAKDLPPKVESAIYCDMSPQQEQLYHRWRDYYRAAILHQIAEKGLDKSRMNVLEGLMRLRQIACHPILVEKNFPGKVGKYDTLIDYFDELLSEGHKILVFSQFVKMLTIIRKYLDSKRVPYEYLDGKTRDRKSCVQRFQNDEACKIFLISLRAGGTGLNLTSADYVIHYDPWWNPAVESQATDRAHRIGQDKHVFVYKMITKGTVEEKIVELQERKKELVSNLISTEAGLFKSLNVEDIKSLFS